jgi:hypothetical protein
VDILFHLPDDSTGLKLLKARQHIHGDRFGNWSAISLASDGVG